MSIAVISSGVCECLFCYICQLGVVGVVATPELLPKIRNFPLR